MKANQRKQMRKRRMRRKKIRRVISNVLSICAVAVLMGCTAYLIKNIIAHVSSEQNAAGLRELYRSSVIADASVAEELPTEKPMNRVELDGTAAAAEGTVELEDTIMPKVEDKPLCMYQEQFSDLYRQNNDLIGWIYVNESIDYPVVWRDEDNDYYMTHDFYHNESQSGWIFLDKRNGSDMSDDHLLIYGHNMRLGDMFGELDLYRDLDYVIEHPTIEIHSVWEPEPRRYVIIALVDASMNKDHSSYIKITHFNFETPEAKEEYISAMRRQSIHDLPWSAAADDQLVTLVTCSYSYPNGRFMVLARELHEGETEGVINEQLSQLK